MVDNLRKLAFCRSIMLKRKKQKQNVMWKMHAHWTRGIEDNVTR